LQAYDKACFKFADNYLRMTFPCSVAESEQDTEQVTPQVTPQDKVLDNSGYADGIPQDTPQVTPQVEKLLQIIDRECNRQELQQKVGLADRENFRLNYLQAALEAGLIEMTSPDKPNSKNQKYRLTNKGKALKYRL
jgi:hypothetical protein